MNKVTFKINKLGAIRDSLMELYPLMIFSGESGLGKSYAAFLVHYLYEIFIRDRLKNFFSDSGYDFNTMFDGRKSGDTLLVIPISEIKAWLNKDAITYIGYLIGNPNLSADVDIEFQTNSGALSFTFSEDMRGLKNHEEVYYTVYLGEFSYSVLADTFIKDSSAFVELTKAYFRNLIFGDFKRFQKAYILPPSRGALMELDTKPEFRSGMYDELFYLKNQINRAVPTHQNLDEDIINCCNLVNNGKLQWVNGQYMYTTHGVNMPLTAAASSIKELSPLTLYINKYPVSDVSFLFEEPEAHVHPNRQIKLADLIGCMLNSGCNLQITSHSDYFLKRLNNLMKIYCIKENMESEKFMQFLSKWNIKTKYLINPKQVGAYILEDNGDGTSSIKKQDVMEEIGIPFDSFYHSISEDIQLSNEINAILNK